MKWDKFWFFANVGAVGWDLHAMIYMDWTFVFTLMLNLTVALLLKHANN